MINVLLVDDHELVRAGIRRILEDIKGIKVVGEASCGEDAVKWCRANAVDVVLMDMSMNRPGFPGECFICELRLPDHRFRWKHNKLFLLLPEEYGPAFPAIVDC
ncbi:response regulator, partial [Escherichia coli]|uniref:response regulator n=1 Tax=Escherichia coli TaxID=562 RepID=UPI00201AE8C8